MFKSLCRWAKAYKLQIFIALMCTNAFCVGVNTVGAADRYYDGLSGLSFIFAALFNLLAVVCVGWVIISTVKRWIHNTADKAYRVYVETMRKKFESGENK